MRKIIIGAVIFMAFGLPQAMAQQLPPGAAIQIAELSQWSATQCSSQQCRDEAIELIRGVQDLANRAADYLKTRTPAEYDAIQQIGRDLATRIESWATRYKIVVVRRETTGSRR